MLAVGLEDARVEVRDRYPSGLNSSHEWILNNLLCFHLPFYPVSGDASQKWLQGRGWRQLWQGTRKVSSLCFNNINRKCLYISHWIKKGNIIHSFLESFLFVHKYIFVSTMVVLDLVFQGKIKNKICITCRHFSLNQEFAHFRIDEDLFLMAKFV